MHFVPTTLLAYFCTSNKQNRGTDYKMNCYIIYALTGSHTCKLKTLFCQLLWNTKVPDKELTHQMRNTKPGHVRWRIPAIPAPGMLREVNLSSGPAWFTKWTSGLYSKSSSQIIVIITIKFLQNLQTNRDIYCKKYCDKQPLLVEAVKKKI